MRMWRNWQTHKTKDLMKAISCRFKSCHPHQKERLPKRVGVLFAWRKMTGLEPLGIFALGKTLFITNC